MAGTYTDIVEIVAPDEAVAGSVVSAQVRIKNRHSASIHIYAVAVLDSEDRFIDWLDSWVSPGQTKTFYGSFTMPSQDVTIHAYSYYEASDGYLYWDDAREKEVSVSEAVEGAITRKEMEYDSAQESIPISGVLQGNRGLVHIRGRNDMSAAQRMGVYWFVADPAGLIAEEYSDWEAWPYTGAGQEHEFIGGRFYLNQVGTYTIWVELLMNPDNPQVVDRYIGDLCAVEAELVPEFSQLAAVSFNKV